MMVKQLKPYHIKADSNYLYVIVSPPYFTLSINGPEYQLAPTKTKEIIMDRREKIIANPEAEFAFRKDNELIYVTMVELMQIPDFLMMLDRIAAPFFIAGTTDYDLVFNDVLIDELERLNIKRLIDKSLDERNERNFFELLKLL